MTRIMFCDPRPLPGEDGGIAEALHGEGHSVESFSDGAHLLEAAVADPPDLVVYAIGQETDPDIAVLRLLRRAQPDVKLIVLARDASLSARSAVQALRPTFYSLSPFDTAEVIAVVRATMRRRAPSR